MYRGCDAIGGNWLNWAAVSQATVAGNVTIATPAECILPGQPEFEEYCNTTVTLRQVGRFIRKRQCHSTLHATDHVALLPQP